MYIDNGLLNINDIISKVNQGIKLNKYEIYELISSMITSLKILKNKIYISNNNCIFNFYLNLFNKEKRNIYLQWYKINNKELELIEKFTKNIGKKFNQVNDNYFILKVIINDYEKIFHFEDNKLDIINNMSDNFSVKNNKVKKIIK